MRFNGFRRHVQCPPFHTFLAIVAMAGQECRSPRLVRQTNGDGALSLKQHLLDLHIYTRVLLKLPTVGNIEQGW